jgi:hypothetical protein
MRVQLETFGHLAARVGKKGVWRRKPKRENPAVCGPFASSEVVMSVRRTGWLGREDSNLRMVESKSANPLNDFNGHSEKSVEYSLKGINRLANDSE